VFLSTYFRLAPGQTKSVTTCYDEEFCVLFLQSSDILKFVSTPVSLRCISFQENY